MHLLGVRWAEGSAKTAKPPEFRGFLSVEAMGIEPTTPALQRQCSSQLSYAP